MLNFILPLFEATPHCSSSFSGCKCVFQEMSFHLLQVYLQLLLCITWNLLHTRYFLQQSLIPLYSRVFYVPGCLWNLINGLFTYQANNRYKQTSLEKCVITRKGQLTIAVFLAVRDANIVAIFSIACFSSLAASSCLTGRI